MFRTEMETGDSSTSDCQQVDASRRAPKEAANGANTSSAKSKGKGEKAQRAKRTKALNQAFSTEEGANTVETDATLKVLSCGQPLVDDFDDADFEARKVGQGPDRLVHDAYTT